jgi:hypothetical protein
LVQLLGVFGGYVVAAQTAVLLAFVVAVSVPAPAGAAGARPAAWTLAGGISLAASVLLSPRHARTQVRQRAGDACLALGALLADPERQRFGIGLAPGSRRPGGERWRAARPGDPSGPGHPGPGSGGLPARARPPGRRAPAGAGLGRVGPRRVERRRRLAPAAHAALAIAIDAAAVAEREVGWPFFVIIADLACYPSDWPRPAGLLLLFARDRRA